MLVVFISEKLELCISLTDRCTFGQIQLIGTQVASQGKAEFCYDEEWWPVCIEEIGLEEYVVACRQLGYFTGYHDIGKWE